MPIKTLPARPPELGRVRMGATETVTAKSGKEVERPKRLDTWRLTTHLRDVADMFASRYGGAVEPWAKQDGHFEVFSTTNQLEVMLPADPLSLDYEAWTAGGCQRRCDGERCVKVNMDDAGGHLEEEDCECVARGWVPGNADDVKAGGCDLHVRLRLVLPDMPGLGVFLLQSGSYYAAVELQGNVEMLTGLAARGVLVPAVLAIEPREEKKAWEKYPRKYSVPSLRLRQSPNELMAAARDGQRALAAPAHVDQTTGEIAAPATAALPAGSGNGGGAKKANGNGQRTAAPTQSVNQPSWERALHALLRGAGLEGDENADRRTALLEYVTDGDASRVTGIDPKVAEKAKEGVKRYQRGGYAFTVGDAGVVAVTEVELEP